MEKMRYLSWCVSETGAWRSGRDGFSRAVTGDAMWGEATVLAIGSAYRREASDEARISCAAEVRGDAVPAASYGWRMVVDSKCVEPLFETIVRS